MRLRNKLNTLFQKILFLWVRVDVLPRDISPQVLGGAPGTVCARGTRTVRHARA